VELQGHQPALQGLTVLRRTAFKSKLPERVRQRDREYIPSTLKPVTPGSYGACGERAEAIPKESVLVCEAYRVLVRLMPCAHCGYPPRSQFCHSDEGKGMGLKTDDRRGWPGCGPHDHKPGCHHLIGSTGTFTKQQRRDLEDEYARRTRAEILARGLWPKRLPLWEES